MAGLSARGRLPSAAALAACLCAGGCQAVPLDNDRWVGRDKAEHFFTAMAIGAGYVRGAGDPDRTARARNEAVALVFVLGSAKELNDAQVRGKGWSWRDMAWNLAGAAIGARLQSGD